MMECLLHLLGKISEIAGPYKNKINKCQWVTDHPGWGDDLRAEAAGLKELQKRTWLAKGTQWKWRPAGTETILFHFYVSIK